MLCTFKKILVLLIIVTQLSAVCSKGYMLYVSLQTPIFLICGDFVVLVTIAHHNHFFVSPKKWGQCYLGLVYFSKCFYSEFFLPKLHQVGAQVDNGIVPIHSPTWTTDLPS